MAENDDLRDKVNNPEAVNNAEVEDKAKEADKDDETAAVNKEEGKIVDIDDIIAKDEALSYGLKKLQDIGFSPDRFKELLKMKTSFRTGDSEDILISSARSVFNAIVIRISDDKNGIVLNPDGSLNEVKSEKQKEEIARINDVLKKTTELTKEKSDKIFNELQDEYKKNKENNSNIILMMSSPKIDDLDKYFKGLASLLEDAPEMNGILDDNYVDEKTDAMMLQDLKSVLSLTADQIATLSDEEKKEKIQLLVSSAQKDFGDNEIDYWKCAEKIKEFIPSLKDFQGNEDELMAEALRYIGIDATKDNVLEEAQKIEKNIISNKKRIISLSLGQYNDETMVLLLEARIELLEKGSPEWNSLVRRRDALYDKNPDLAKYADNLRDGRENLTSAARTKVMERANGTLDSKIKEIVEKIGTNADFSNLNENQIMILLMGAVDTNGKNRMVKMQCLEYLEKIMPGLKKGFSTPEEFFKLNQEILNRKNITGKGTELTPEAYVALVEGARKTLFYNFAKRTTEILITSRENQSEHQEDIQKIAPTKRSLWDKIRDLNHKPLSDDEVAKNAKMQRMSEEMRIDPEAEFEINLDITKSIFQNRFINSNVEMSDIDEMTFNNMYRTSTVNTWISSLEQAKLKTYVSLLLAVKREAGDPNSTKKIRNMAQRQLDKFAKENPDVIKEIEGIPEDFKDSLMQKQADFETQKSTAKMLDYFSNTMLLSKFNYSSLKESDKKEYMRYVLLAGTMAERAKDSSEKQVLTKLYYRGLELMNTDDKTIISFSENGKAIINEKNLAKEYKGKDAEGRKITTIEEILADNYAKHTRLYVRKQIKRVSKLR